MTDYAIVTDSSCDLPEELVREKALTVIPLSVRIGDHAFRNVPGEGLDCHAFYELLRSGVTGQTSAANMDEFKGALRPLLEEGKDILYLGFSSALSGTYQNGVLAMEELQEEFPKARLLWVDTLCASLGQGLMVDLAVQKKRERKTIDQVRDYVESEKFHLCHWFTVSDLAHLRRGGRLSAGKALLGTLLHIKPVMHVDDSGRLTPVDTVKGRTKSMAALVAYMKKTATEPEKQTVYISHGDCLEDAKKLAEMVQEALSVKQVILGEVGPVIGAHSGPGTLALFFLGKNR